MNTSRRGRLFGVAVVCTLIGSVVSCASDEVQLVQAASQGNLSLVTTLLAQGVDVNARSSLDGGTALMEASAHGYSEIVTALLAQGADVHANDRDGKTALLQAAEWGHSEIVTVLLAQGADVNATDSNGTTALMFAIINPRSFAWPS